jgi:hypothetical protein
MARDPLVIRQTLGENDSFDGTAPKSGPDRDLEGTFHNYVDVSSGGLFKFSSTKYMRLKRVIADLKDATSWALRIVHPDLPGEPTKLLLNHTSEGGNLVDKDLDVILHPGEHLTLVSTGGDGGDWAELTALPITDPKE